MSANFCQWCGAALVSQESRLFSPETGKRLEIKRCPNWPCCYGVHDWEPTVIFRLFWFIPITSMHGRCTRCGVRSDGRPPLSTPKPTQDPKETGSMQINLGNTYRDKITGFQGVATGFVQYLTGCNQALIAPKVAPDGAVRDSAWIDVQRLELQENEARVTLNNGPTPGFDKAAPRR